MHVPQRVIRPHSFFTECLAEAKIPTRHGEFETHIFRGSQDAPGRAELVAREHVALVRGEVCGAEDVLVRVHSECITGEVFGSLKWWNPSTMPSYQARKAFSLACQPGSPSSSTR